MVLLSLQSHCQSSMNVEQHAVATDPQTKPTDLGCESTCKLID